jgi:hypothetical protein
MLALNQTMKSHKHRKGLTTKEKDIIINVYNNCSTVELENFTEVVVAYKVKRIDSSIPLKLVGSFVAELEAEKAA